MRSMRKKNDEIMNSSAPLMKNQRPQKLVLSRGLGGKPSEASVIIKKSRSRSRSLSSSIHSSSRKINQEKEKNREKRSILPSISEIKDPVVKQRDKRVIKTKKSSKNSDLKLRTKLSECRTINSVKMVLKSKSNVSGKKISAVQKPFEKEKVVLKESEVEYREKETLIKQMSGVENRNDLQNVNNTSPNAKPEVPPASSVVEKPEIQASTLPDAVFKFSLSKDAASGSKPTESPSQSKPDNDPQLEQDLPNRSEVDKVMVVDDKLTPESKQGIKENITPNISRQTQSKKADSEINSVRVISTVPSVIYDDAIDSKCSSLDTFDDVTIRYIKKGKAKQTGTKKKKEPQAEDLESYNDDEAREYAKKMVVLCSPTSEKIPIQRVKTDVRSTIEVVTMCKTPSNRTLRDQLKPQDSGRGNTSSRSNDSKPPNQSSNTSKVPVDKTSSGQSAIQHEDNKSPKTKSSSLVWQLLCCGIDDDYGSTMSTDELSYDRLYSFMTDRDSLPGI